MGTCADHANEYKGDRGMSPASALVAAKNTDAYNRLTRTENEQKCPTFCNRPEKWDTFRSYRIVFINFNLLNGARGRI